MRRTQFAKLCSRLMLTVLIAATAYGSTGCGTQNNPPETTAESEVNAQTVEKSVLGNGKIQFDFSVIDSGGNEASFEIHTDKTIVGDALTELELIAGDEGQYGLYVTTVNGITLDFDKDGMYWAFYINGEYGMSGVDVTEIENGASYAFKAEK